MRQNSLVFLAIKATNLSNYHLHISRIILQLAVEPTLNAEGKAHARISHIQRVLTGDSTTIGEHADGRVRSTHQVSEHVCRVEQ